MPVSVIEPGTEWRRTIATTHTEGMPGSHGAEGFVRIGPLELPAAEAASLSNAALLAMLLESGTSRLSAERIVELNGCDGSRARSHSRSRGM